MSVQPLDSIHNKTTLHPIKAILFDLDGTLVHSTLNFKQMKQDIHCPEDLDILAYLDTLSEEERLLAENVIMRHELDDANSAKIMRGANNLLERLEQMGLKTAIVTRNSNEATQIKIEKCGLRVQQILTREDAPAKPNPEGLLYFCQLWNLPSSACVYVGDYLYDLQAANTAQMHACLYLHDPECSGIPSYASLADFICHDFGVFENQLIHYLQARKSDIFI